MFIIKIVEEIIAQVTKNLHVLFLSRLLISILLVTRIREKEKMTGRKVPQISRRQSRFKEDEHVS